MDMSQDPTTLTAAHFRYIAAHATGGEDDFLRLLKDKAVAAGIPPIWISPEQAAFMQVLLRAARARDVLEVGTLAGYSAIAMARALPPGGRVRTVEVYPKHADFAEEWIARSNVGDRIEVIRGAGQVVLPTLRDNSVDAAFLDADKEGYPLYLRECLRIVRRGGLVMVDNAFAFGQLLDERPTDREVPAIRAFNETMAREPRLSSVIVPVGDGLWVGVKER